MRGRRWAFRGPAMITGSANLYYTLAISPLPPPLLYGCSALSIISFYLSFLSLRPPFLRRVTLSLSPSLSNPQEHSVGPDSGPFARRIVTCIFYGRTVPSFPYGYAHWSEKKSFSDSGEREREKERDCGQAEARHTRTLSPKLDTIERTSIPSVITFVSLMLARPPGYLSLRSRARIRSSIDLHPAGPLFRVSARPGPILL